MSPLWTTNSLPTDGEPITGYLQRVPDDGDDDDDDDDDDGDGEFVSLYISFMYTYLTAQAVELQHHYFSQVVWRGVKQSFMVVGQTRFVCFTS